MLPSLDRLSGLVERVVELVDAVGDTASVPAPEPVAEPPQDPPPEATPQPAHAAAPAGWVAFVASAHGYRLLDGSGPIPARGATIELEGAPHRVEKVGPSPLPGDARRCVHVVGEEPRGADRTSDA